VGHLLFGRKLKFSLTAAFKNCSARRHGLGFNGIYKKQSDKT
jgi:hypothetical protein